MFKKKGREQISPNIISEMNAAKGARSRARRRSQQAHPPRVPPRAAFQPRPPRTPGAERPDPPDIAPVPLLTRENPRPAAKAAQHPPPRRPPLTSGRAGQAQQPLRAGPGSGRCCRPAPRAIRRVGRAGGPAPPRPLPPATAPLRPGHPCPPAAPTGSGSARRHPPRDTKPRVGVCRCVLTKSTLLFYV